MSHTWWITAADSCTVCASSWLFQPAGNDGISDN